MSQSLDKGLKLKVCILTSVHPAFDTHIFHKEAKTLLKVGYEIIIVLNYIKNEIY